jgi:hypothetical protein
VKEVVIMAGVNLAPAVDVFFEISIFELVFALKVMNSNERFIY